MHELRSMDEEFQRKMLLSHLVLVWSPYIFDSKGVRETYTKHRRSYAKALKNAAPNHSTNLGASRSQLEKEYQKALQKQDEKIELALRMYDLVSRHIERIDSQMAKSGIDGGDWIGNRASSNRSWEDRWRNEGKRQRLDIKAMYWMLMHDTIWQDNVNALLHHHHFESAHHDLHLQQVTMAHWRSLRLIPMNHVIVSATKYPLVIWWHAMEKM